MKKILTFLFFAMITVQVGAQEQIPYNEWFTDGDKSSEMRIVNKVAGEPTIAAAVEVKQNSESWNVNFASIFHDNEGQVTGNDFLWTFDVYWDGTSEKDSTEISLRSGKCGKWKENFFVHEDYEMVSYLNNDGTINKDGNTELLHYDEYGEVVPFWQGYQRFFKISKGKWTTISYASNIKIGEKGAEWIGPQVWLGSNSGTFYFRNIRVKMGGNELFYYSKTTIDGIKYIIGGNVAYITGFSDNEATSVNIPETVEYGGRIYTVVTIEKNAFSGYSKLTSVTIPNHIRSIGDNAFSGCNSLTYLLSNSATPPQVTDQFSIVDTVYVKKECVDAYQNAAVWKWKVILPFYTLSAKSADNTMGVVKSDSVLFGDKPTTITAVPAKGYHFVKWSDGNTDNPRQFSSAKDAMITATFAAHTKVVDEAVAATTTSTGLTEGSHCAFCNEVIVAQEVIPMITDNGQNNENQNNSGRHPNIPATDPISAIINQIDNIHNIIHSVITDVEEEAVNEVNVHAFDNTIIVENADAEIFIYDAMGRLVCRSNEKLVRTELQTNSTGVYIVKVGKVAKRVVVN